MYVTDSGLLEKYNHLFLNFDDDGFLLEPKIWNHLIAQQTADINGVGKLNTIHITIIQFIRDSYFELGGFVTPRRICSKLKVDKDEMKRFFGSCTNAWRIAGLPNPGEEAKSYMG